VREDLAERVAGAVVPADVEEEPPLRLGRLAGRLARFLGRGARGQRERRRAEPRCEAPARQRGVDS
jgi:hypothetical protein